jgi:hypothetical protein
MFHSSGAEGAKNFCASAVRFSYDEQEEAIWFVDYGQQE